MPRRKSLQPSLPLTPALLNEKKFILIGGFLGSGKTTVIGSLLKWIAEKGMKAGVILNDQGASLVDSVLTKSRIAAVREVTGGCFCCQASRLGAALRDLEIEEQPDVFIAEPVGSCTDLQATILMPLQKIYDKPLACSIMSVVIDSQRLELAMHEELAGIRSGKTSGFSTDVRYIFDKQLEEAGVLVLNKVDLLSRKRIDILANWISKHHPGKPVMKVSAKTGQGLDEWFSLLMSKAPAPDDLLEIDYERYGYGEARLGWYDAVLGIHATVEKLDGNKILFSLARALQATLESAGVEIAHLKMSIVNIGWPEGASDICVINLVRNQTKPVLSARSQHTFTVGELTINIRAEAEPELLVDTVKSHFFKSRSDAHFIWKKESAFKPGQPKPTYRVTSL